MSSPRSLSAAALVAMLAAAPAGLASGPAEKAAEPAGRSVRDKDGAEMVRVPAGRFRMGLSRSELARARGIALRWEQEPDEATLAAETPAHPVELPAFDIDRLEVTNEQYARFVEATGAAVPASSVGPEFNLWIGKEYPEHLARHPVVNVTWEQARAYCEWAGARLPTEAEWEKAARDDDGRSYPWGSFWDEGRANRGRWDKDGERSRGFGGDGHLNTAPVGSFPLGAGPYGALDQAGNVMEWVADWYDPGYYASSPPARPRGPDEGKEKVLRGGSWYYGPVHMRTTHREHLDPASANANVGFRCARDAGSDP